jgi:hypothetical protein
MQKKKPKWTLIFLLSAKNNLFNEQLKVIKEIYSVGSTDDVNFILLFDAIEGDKFSKKFTAPALYHIKKDSDFLTDISHVQLSSSSKGLTTKKNLKKLLKIAVNDFDADNFGFFYKGHGGPATTDISKGAFDTRLVRVNANMDDDEIEGEFANAQPGWTFEGFCEYPVIAKSSKKQKPVLLIYSKGNTESLSYYAMADVIKRVFSKKPAFICMDCCWAQQIENANKFVGITDYFIASPDEMPALGLGYIHFCKQFVQRPTIKPKEVANLLVSVFYCTNYADYDCDVPEFRKMGVSLTSLSLSNFGSFADPFTKLCNYLIRKLRKKGHEGDQAYLLIRNARNQCLDYTYKDTDKLKAADIDYPLFNIDLIWLLENMLYYNVDMELDNMIFEVINQLQNYLITGTMGNNYVKNPPGSRAIGGNGVAICFPANKAHAEESILKDKKISFFKTTGWREMLYLYYNYAFSPKKYKNKKNTFDGMVAEEPLKIDEDRLIFKKAKHKK